MRVTSGMNQSIPPAWAPCNQRRAGAVLGQWAVRAPATATLFLNRQSLRDVVQLLGQYARDREFKEPLATIATPTTLADAKRTGSPEGAHVAAAAAVAGVPVVICGRRAIEVLARAGHAHGVPVDTGVVTRVATGAAIVDVVV